jgi:hypothetical protein
LAAHAENLASLTALASPSKSFACIITGKSLVTFPMQMVVADPRLIEVVGHWKSPLRVQLPTLLLDILTR